MPNKERKREPRVEKSDYLHVSAVAALFHVSTRTVARWADEGRLPHVLTLGGHRRFHRKDIEDLVAQLQRVPPEDADSA